jgi:hypothetical protein
MSQNGPPRGPFDPPQPGDQQPSQQQPHPQSPQPGYQQPQPGYQQPQPGYQQPQPGYQQPQPGYQQPQPGYQPQQPGYQPQQPGQQPQQPGYQPQQPGYQPQQPGYQPQQPGYQQSAADQQPPQQPALQSFLPAVDHATSLTEVPKITVLSWVSFGISLGGFLVGWVPYVSLGAGVGVLLAILDLAKADGKPRRKTVSVISLVLGGLGTLAGLGWLFATFMVLRSSCPHVYAHDGEGWRLDADPLSGALLPGAERTDWDRLEHLAAVDGAYRVRVVDELEEIDRIDDVALLVIDHAPGTAALPTPEGAIVQVRGAAAPRRATDSRGRDVTAKLVAADGDAFSGTPSDFDPDGPAEPRERLTLELPRPTGAAAGGPAALVLRAHNAPFAEEAFARYVARMGPGTGALMDAAQEASWYPYRTRISDEIRRLGLPLEVRVGGAGQVVEVAPVGPAIQRDFVVPIELPAGDSPNVAVTLELTPGFWEIDAVSLAGRPGVLAPRRVLARRAERLGGPGAPGAADAELLEALAAADERRVELHTGQGVELTFDAPPLEAGAERTVVLEIRGSYEMGSGGRGWLDPIAILSHRRGWDSLPRFAGRLGRGR